MARPSSSNKNLIASKDADVFLAEDLGIGVEIQEEKKEKQDPNKAEKKKADEKKKDVFVWHMDEGDEGEVEVIITDKGKVKSFTLKEPVIIINKDESGKEIAITSKGNAIDIKKGKKGTWIVKGDAVTLHKNLEGIELDEGSVITLKTKSKDGHKTIKINAPAAVLKKIDDSVSHIKLHVSEEGGKKKVVYVAPHIHMEKHPDVQVQMKESELKKIHEKLKKIHERLSKKMESKTEEEELALREMEEALKKMEKKLSVMENKLKDITLSIHEEPHQIELKHGHAVSIKHKADAEEGEKDVFYIAEDKDQLMSFVDEQGEVTFLSHMELDKMHKQTFTDAVKDIEKNLPEGYKIESEYDEKSGKATIKVKGHVEGKDTMGDVIALLKGLEEKLDTKNK
jgi:hypothetical protein